MDHTLGVVELRQYTLHPGRRDELIELFERELIESQEATGMRLIGQFRDRDNADRFVWLRGFRDMATRGQALPAFYGSTTWKTHRNAANATMIDSDDVLLLRPVHAHSGFDLPYPRPSLDAIPRPASLIVASICLLQAPVDADFVHSFDTEIRPLLVAAGAVPLAYFQSETAENNFPALPVRSSEHAFVWFTSFASPEQHAHSLAQWRDRVAATLARRLQSPMQVLLLEPTPRSVLGRTLTARRPAHPAGTP